MKKHHVSKMCKQKVAIGSAARRSVFAILLTASIVYMAPGYAATCTVNIPDYLGEGLSDECFIDTLTNTVVMYDANYWGKRGRKLLVPQTVGGRKSASFVAISPTDVRSNDVAHAMEYKIVVKTNKGLYRFVADTPTKTYQSNTPPSVWQWQRPNERMDYADKLTTAEMLAKLQAIKPAGPALDLAVIEKVISQNQNLNDRLPTLAGINVELLPSKQADAQSATTQTSSSGLIYQSLREGSGASPSATDVVRVNYRGTLSDSGKEFDSSYKSHGSEGVELPLNQVIVCWTEGIQKMKPGGKAMLTCPPSIAYGASGAGSVIPPNATLNFEVELISVKSIGGSVGTDRKQALTQANQSKRPVRSPNLDALIQKTLGKKQ